MSELPRSKGSRPVFLGEATDDLLAMLMAVTQELAVLRERCDTAERLLMAKGVLGPSEMEDYRPGQDVLVMREQWRRDYLDRVLQPVKARADERAKGETKASYDGIIDEIGRIDA